MAVVECGDGTFKVQVLRILYCMYQMFTGPLKAKLLRFVELIIFISAQKEARDGSCDELIIMSKVTQAVTLPVLNKSVTVKFYVYGIRKRTTKPLHNHLYHSCKLHLISPMNL